MNFIKKIEKISKDREDGKCFNIFGYDFKLRSFKSKYVKQALLKNKVKNINESIEHKEDEKVATMLNNIIVDWDLIDENTKEKIEVNKENIEKLLLQKDEKGNYKAEAFLWELLEICFSFDDPKVDALYGSVKNF